MARKIELAAIAQAHAKLDSLIGAARGEKTSCAIFDGHYGEFTERQREILAVYVESWILGPLEAAEKGMAGDRSWSNESYLQQISTDKVLP